MVAPAETEDGMTLQRLVLCSRHAASCKGLVRMYYIFRNSPTL
jgi:hypothetical protein